MHKGGDRGSSGSCRPVRLTSFMLKTLARCLRNRIVNHLEANGFLVIEQHEFRHKPCFLVISIGFLDTTTFRIDRGEKGGSLPSGLLQGL